MVFVFCFIEQASSFVKQCLSSLTYLCNGYTHTHTLAEKKWGNRICFCQVCSSEFPVEHFLIWMLEYVNTDTQRSTDEWHRNKPTHVCASVCTDEQVGIHPHRQTDVHTQTNTQTHTHQHTHILLPTESTSWWWLWCWKKNFPLQLPLRMWQRWTVFLWTHKDNVSTSSH